MFIYRYLSQVVLFEELSVDTLIQTLLTDIRPHELWNGRKYEHSQCNDKIFINQSRRHLEDSPSNVSETEQVPIKK